LSALQGRIATGIRHSNTLKTDLMYVAVPIASGGVIRGAVRITYPTATLSGRVNRYWLLLGAIGAVVLAAATVVGLLFARTLTRPLLALEQTAAAVGAGDLQARAPTDSGPPEIRALASELQRDRVETDALIRSQREFVADASHQLRTPLARAPAPAREPRLRRRRRGEAEPGALAPPRSTGSRALVDARSCAARARTRRGRDPSRSTSASLTPASTLFGRARRPRRHGAGARAQGTSVVVTPAR
jgi:signal transduction histidine kinase